MNGVIVNLSGIYNKEEFWKQINLKWIDAEKITGTNCYCDDEAKKILKDKLENVETQGIHFIDSGNYHYMSNLFLEKINRPFRLIVFDNHTDMQLPAFGNILSCGGWIATSLEEIEYLEEVILIGPDENAFEQVDESLKKKVIFYSREWLMEHSGEERSAILKNIKLDLPIYISIDKDILGEKDAATTWSQGDMTIEQLLLELDRLNSLVQEYKGEIIGIDVCGECDHETGESNLKNTNSNKKIYEYVSKNIRFGIMEEK